MPKEEKVQPELVDYAQAGPPAEEPEVTALPEQKEFYKVPKRFGNIPVDELPLGCDKDKQYYGIYPRISLPFQRVERISFGHPGLEPNRLFFGDNLHIMRMLPSNSIDLIYIDPPFFSGRHYNLIFGDANEVRSFSDIWESGMPGYLTWLNARLLEMKRLLKPTGCIWVHLDWHAGHYVKVEMDKIFGYDHMVNQVVWKRQAAHGDTKQGAKHMGRNHDILLLYGKGDDRRWNMEFGEYDEEYIETHYRFAEGPNGEIRTLKRGEPLPPGWRRFRKGDLTAAKPGGDTQYAWKGVKPYPGRYWAYSKEKMEEFERQKRLVYTKTGMPEYKRYRDEMEGSPLQDTWTDIPPINAQANERIGYPTQKPEELLERIINLTSNEDDVVADFFCGGGTTPAVAQRLNRRWIACDNSRIAVAITADRLTRQITKPNGDSKTIQRPIVPTPDISVEHWGIYEVPSLTILSNEEFRQFVIAAFNGRVASTDDIVHGYKDGIPLYVGPSSQEKPVTKDSVLDFAKAVVTKKGKSRGTMLAWSFADSAVKAAQKIEAESKVSVDLVKIALVQIESHEFRDHIVSKHKEYADLLVFILPPEVRVSHKRVGPKTYEFDISESASMNPGGKVMNVQWDFDFKGRFASTRGYSFIRGEKGNPKLTVAYTFPGTGKWKVACKVQDDRGGEKTEVLEVQVS